MKKFELPPISKEYYEYLSKAFRVTPIEPETARDRIMFEAGQQAMLEFIRASVVSPTTISSDPKDLKTENTGNSWKDRLFGWFR